MIPQNTEFDTRLNELFRQKNWQGIIRLMRHRCQPKGDLWDDPVALATFGFALTQQRQWDRAREVYFRCIDLEPDRAVSYYNMGYVEYARQQWRKAIYWFDEALKRYPDYMVVLYRKGYALYAWEKAAQARPVLEKAIQVYQQHTDEDWQRRNRKYLTKSFFTLGRVYLRLRQPRKAIDCFQWILEHDRKGTIAKQFLFYELGKAYVQQKEYREALEYLQKAANMHPPREYIWDQLGRAYHGSKHYPQALACYQKALRLRKQAYIYTNMAFTYWALQQHAETVRYFHYALEQDLQHKMHHKIYLALGRLYLQKHQFQQAEQYYRSAIQAKQKYYGAAYAMGYYELAICYARQGKKEAAQQSLKAALEANPNLEWDKHLLAAVYDETADLPPLVDVVMN